MTDLGSCSNCGKPRPADAAFVCPFCGRPYVSEKPPSSSSMNAKALAGITWLTSAALIGYFGGAAFEGDPLRGLLFGLALAMSVTLLVEVVRFARRRAQPVRIGSSEPSSGGDA